MDETVKEASVKALTAGQRALWILSRLAPESSAYQTSRAIRIRGPLDSRKLLQVYERLSIAKPSLRTELVERDGAPLQSLNASANIRTETLDVSGWSELELAERINREANRPFELGGEPLFRILLLRRTDDDTVLVATAHQLLLDPDSYFVVLEELLAGYGNEEKLSAEADEPELQSDREDRRDEDAARTYWLQKLNGTLPVLHLPADKPRPPVRTFGGSDLSFRIPDGLAQSLRKAAANERLDLQELLLAAYQVLLHRYSNQDDVLIGVFFPPDDDAQGASDIGSYSNPVVVRSDLSEDAAFADFFRKTGTALAEAYERRDFPFPQLVELLQPDRDPSFPALFQASYSYRKQQGRYAAGVGALAFENEGKEFEFADGLTFEPIRLARKEVQYDLRLSVIDDGEAAIGRFDYYSDLFEAGTIERLKDNFLTLLESIALQPEEQAKRLNLLAEGERELLLGDWSGATKPFPEVAIHSLFEERAALHPDKEAVVFGEERWTYRELNERANRLAHYLRKNGVVPDTLVGVFLERTLDIPVVLFAILKAGGAYVPLDPHYPKDRIAVTLEDSRAPIIVTRSDLASLLPADYEGKIVRYDEEQDVIARESALNPEGGAEPRHLAYVIYTSGSTGRPKGVAIEHRSTTRWIYAAQELFEPEKDFAGVLASTSISFDMSCFEFFVALGSGGKAILAENALHLPLLPAREEVTLINTVPSAVAELVRSKGIPDSVRVCNFGGEPLFGSLVRQLFKRHPSVVKAYNLYGPTEDTTFSTYEIVRGSEEGEPTIGRPIPNTSVYILDSERQPVPIGVHGELYLGGDGLAREYLNRPDLTGERFVPNPFSDKPGERLYRTGDLVRFLPDSRIQYFGRLDHQVKIRGFRIELGEIESVLLAHPSVSEAVVQAREGEKGRKRLIAYAEVANKDATSTELRSYVKSRLPDFMVPSAIFTLDKFPLSPNGKLNRLALPEPDVSWFGSEHPYEEPRDDIERKLARSWQDLLGIERIGIHDNFFESGGDSLLSERLAADLAKEGIRIASRDLFGFQTIADLAAWIRSKALAG